MLQKITHNNDAETNKWLREHPNVYIIKMIITDGKQHFLYTENDRLRGKDHLQSHTQIDNGKGVHNGILINGQEVF